ncbi:MAG: B12-binding domain-containing protein, partial [Actinomycetota bacterium]
MFVEFDPGLLRHETAQRIVALQYDRASHLVGRYGPDGRDRCVEDIAFSLLYLDAAVAMGRAELFLEYLRWLKQLFARLGIAIEDLAGSLEAMRDVLTAEGHAAAAAVVDAGVRALPGLEVVPWRPMEDCGHLADVAWAYLNALLGGDRRRAGQVVGDAAAGGVAIEDLYLHVFQPCLREVGRRWLEGEVSVAVEHLFTAATQMILSQFYPRIFERPANGKTVLAVCAEGELHEVGIRMVADL